MTGEIAVFAGPSLPAAFRPIDPALVWHPPAVAGDLLALTERPPAAVCLIDGYFDQRPAPWHKEALLLMERGVRLFGAASVGALRAAELDRFGMIGVGAIYRAYRDGWLTGDDEVALVHAPEELGWAALSVPMVEVRATLAAACRARWIRPEAARTIRDAAQSIYFAERDWAALGRRCRDLGAVDQALFDRIAARHVPLKRRDALACLALALGGGGSSTGPSMRTPWTCFMTELTLEMQAAAQPSR